MIAQRHASSDFSAACTQCGGVTREIPGRQYLQCEYCESLVFPHGNPLATDGIVSNGSEIDASCPCCRVPLQTGDIDGHRALYCRQCLGILLRNSSFGDVIRNRRAARAHQERQDVRPIDPDEYKRSLNCPSCRKNMETHPYYGPGNVVIDSCCNCGYVWLDHGELATLERTAGRSATAPVIRPATAPASQPTADSVPHALYVDESPLQALIDMLF